MNSSSRAATAMFSTANPHALATILEASQTRSIIASRDIFDISGIKLWARDQPVSGALQRKLLDRELRNPLESCLMAEDGVTPQTLLRATEALVERDSPIGALLQPHAARIVRAGGAPAAALGRPAAADGRPGVAPRIVRPRGAGDGAGRRADGRARRLGRRAAHRDARRAAARPRRDVHRPALRRGRRRPAARLHELPAARRAPARRPPAADAADQLSRRRDRGGRPSTTSGSTARATRTACRAKSISPLGKLLAVTEAALGVLRSERPYLARISVALRVVPGEFDLSWVGRIADAARVQPALHAELDVGEVQARLARLDGALRGAQECADELARDTGSAALKGAVGLAQHLLGRLRKGWYASGLWSAGSVGRWRCCRGRSDRRRTLLPAALDRTGNEATSRPVERQRCARAAAAVRVSERGRGCLKLQTAICGSASNCWIAMRTCFCIVDTARLSPARCFCRHCRNNPSSAA